MGIIILVCKVALLHWDSIYFQINSIFLGAVLQVLYRNKSGKGLTKETESKQMAK